MTVALTARPIIITSGGFDPVHPGHLRLFYHASLWGDVFALVNSDDWLIRKKGFVFQSFSARRHIVEALEPVWQATGFCDEDGTATQGLAMLRCQFPHRRLIFANGGDRRKGKVPEEQWCREHDVELAFGIGGDDKVDSSSLIGVRDAVERPWGQYRTLYEDAAFKVKRLIVNPHSATSEQRHRHRRETWVFPWGQTDVIPMGDWHRLRNDRDEPLSVIEVQTGERFDEDDIERRT